MFGPKPLRGLVVGEILGDTYKKSVGYLGMSVNVKDSQFGAIGNGQADDTAAIQRAINYAKSLTSAGGAYRATIYFPAGIYYITSPINITNTNGIWLTGDGGRYINSSIVGNTSGPIFDFSGSNISGCEGITFISPAGYGGTRSTIGVVFALTSNGGLNCGIRNCYFQLEDFATANGGFGTIGILNVRSEEFFIHECLIRANTPIVMSSSTNLGETGNNFVASSPYQTLTSGTGSMGVTSIKGTSLQGYEKRQPALVLNGTNSLTFEGYMGRVTTANGSNETAIQCVRYTTNLNINATIESYSRILKATLAGLDGNTINVVMVNSSVPTTDLIDLTGCSVKALKAKVTLPNTSERLNRYFIYHMPVGNGYQQATGFMTNSDLTCFDIIDNQYAISANLLKRSDNVVFNTDQPFEKKGGRIKQLFTNPVSAGTSGAVTSATILRFRESNQLPFNNTNAGYYRIWIDGVVNGGSYGSGVSFVLCFQAQLVITQSYNGQYGPPSVTVIILDKSVTNPAALDIASISLDLSFSNGYGIIKLTPRITGTATTEPISYNGQAELQNDFLVNEAIITK